MHDPKTSPDVRETELLTSENGYVHTQTFFQHNRWTMHEKIGELLANGIQQISMVLIGADWQLSWIDHRPPDVIKAAKETDPS
jgi:hypothetical protein